MNKEKLKKVIVIGLDGFEPTIVESMLLAGELPNMARLREEGGYSRLGTTYPAQTPVAWSTFATGTNPGGHGIFDFLTRDPKTYLPMLALSRYEQKNAFVPPTVVNSRRGTPFWEYLTRAGIPAVVLRCPCTYPPDDLNGRMLAGVGVPDLRGGLGTSTFYTTRAGLEAEHSEKVAPVQLNGNGTIQTHVVGPRNPKKRTDYQADIKLTVDTEGRNVILNSDGRPKEIEIEEGEWSEWLKVKFKIGLLQSVQGVVRFYLKSIEPEFEFYASPVNFDPSSPLFPISSPPDYAQELESRLGIYYTMGMAEDHDGLNNGRFDENAYLAQCDDVLREREQMMLYELDKLEEGLFYCLFDTPDRLQHMFWRFREPDHPANHVGLDPMFTQVIEDHYRRCDEIVGKAYEYVDNDTLFIVLSDHGMNSFQRGLNLNTWLSENGFLTLKDGLQPGDEAGDFFRSVDWIQTQAYALGLGGIFLNRRGREAKGIVNKDEAESVEANIIKGLTGLKDPERGQVAVCNVKRRGEIYSGPYVDEAPDLLVNFPAGYRVSWGTPLGGIPTGLFEDNQKKWAGDHVVDPSFVPGVLFMNRLLENENPNLTDIAPTILAALGLSKGPSMEGESLLS